MQGLEIILCLLNKQVELLDLLFTQNRDVDSTGLFGLLLPVDVKVV